MSRLLTPEEIAALRSEAPYVPAPRERYFVVIDAGHTELTHEELHALRPGDVLPLTRSASATVEVVANGTTVAYGELIDVNGRAAVRVATLAAFERRSSR